MHQELLALRRRGARAGAARRPLRGRSRAPRCTTSSAACSRTSRRRRPTPGRRSPSTPPAASAPRWSWQGRACSSCCATGVEPGDVAVVFREPGRYSSLLEQVFGAYGIPYSIDRRLPLRPHRPRARAARADPLRRGRRARAEDLLAYLRTPGLLQRARAGRPPRGRGARATARTRAERRARALGARPLAARRARPSRATRATRRPSSAELESRLDAPVRGPLRAHAPPC